MIELLAALNDLNRKTARQIELLEQIVGLLQQRDGEPAPEAVPAKSKRKGA